MKRKNTSDSLPKLKYLLLENLLTLLLVKYGVNQNDEEAIVAVKDEDKEHSTAFDFCDCALICNGAVC